jgi:hypothetical protein
MVVVRINHDDNAFWRSPNHTPQELKVVVGFVLVDCEAVDPNASIWT